MIEEPRMILPDSGDKIAESPAQFLPEITPLYLPPPKTLFREYFEMSVVTAIQLLFLWTFIAQGMMVPTGSPLSARVKLPFFRPLMSVL